MKSEVLSALLAYYTEKHHWVEEELGKEQTPNLISFFLYLKMSYGREILKLKKLCQSSCASNPI